MLSPITVWTLMLTQRLCERARIIGAHPSTLQAAPPGDMWLVGFQGVVRTSQGACGAVAGGSSTYGQDR